MTEDAFFRSFDVVPIWGVFLIFAFLLLAFSELGFHLGSWQSKRAPESSQIAAIVGSSLGLLAFMLAFTFNIASTRFDARKQVLLNEANAIGTTWLRSQMLPEPYAAEIGPLLKRYVELRIAGATTRSRESLRDAIAESEAIQQELWQSAVDLGKQHPDSVVLGLFITSLNEVIDLHATRLNVARYRIPRSVWVTLLLIALSATMMVGVQAGLGGGRSLLVTALLVLVLSVVLVLIVDLDRSAQTLFKVNQQPMVDLRMSMRQVPTAPPLLPRR